MKAVVYNQYGSPDVLRVEDIEKPTPGDDEILVEVHAVSINPFEWHHMRGKPSLMRFSTGLFKPKEPILGNDVAGRVEAVGKNVTTFQKGDEVFGASGYGGLTEYACISENKAVQKPPRTTFEEAASVPIAGVTALQALRDSGQIGAGQEVLINGASGGVGTFAVQIAKSYGVEVTGVCSTGNLDMVRSIGADHVVDYTQEDFTRNGERYDLVIDAVGNRTVSDLEHTLKPGGRCVIVGFTTLGLLVQHMIFGPLTSMDGDKKIGLMGTAQIIGKDLIHLKELLETRTVVPVLDRTYPLEETPEAVRYLETGHAKGKVIVTTGKIS